MFCLIDRDAYYVVGRIRKAVDALYGIDNGTIRPGKNVDMARDAAQRLELMIEEIVEYKQTNTKESK